LKPSAEESFCVYEYRCDSSFIDKLPQALIGPFYSIGCDINYLYPLALRQRFSVALSTWSCKEQNIALEPPGKFTVELCITWQRANSYFVFPWLEF